MQINHTISAILRGKWLLDKQWAQAHRPLAIRLMQGEPVDFGFATAGKRIDPDGSSDAVKSHPAERIAAAQNVFSISRHTDLRELPNGSIVMVDIFGPLLKHGDICSYGMADYTQLINQLAIASNVSGILLNIDSPGGQVDGTSMLSQAIKEAGRKKPIIAIIDDGMAASAAMWIASAAKEIYVTQKTDQVGSVGVYVTIADWDAHYQDYFKLKVKEIYAPQSTDKNRDYIEALKGNEDPLKEDLSVIATHFINTVATNRAGIIKGNDWKTGKMFYAKDAVEIGLIDGIKSVSQVVKRMELLISTNKQSGSNTVTSKGSVNEASKSLITTKPNVVQNRSAVAPAATITSNSPNKLQNEKPGSLKDDGSKALADKYVNRKQNANPGAEQTGKRGIYVDDGSKALAGTYKPVDHSTKPSWLVDDGSRALVGTYKPVNHSTKPSWYQDDGSEALVKGKTSEKKESAVPC
ncbi:S49 family peptidase [Agriterribacter sp.]|uniref:S49 family peptidase n=1 Tax=Agriterribacter sp. TaxID=2821509 RepID=UPI002C48428D|nr:S49 family peptidase [Agriterribacter sp.]HRO45123.1 S49 family peptidase [Agriterribacter sp.]HRQ15436.1 S49 family peptidase [Agriterribacter sp.]